jgi:hypothetical protein
MSNYRVRQVLALGRLPERQLRLLVALATWMDDDTRTVRLGFDTLIRDTGNVRNTVKLARADAAAAGRLIWAQPQRGRGHLTVWTVLCLPEKGVNEHDPLPESVKGVNPAAEKGSTEPGKRGQPQTADLQEPDHGLNRMAKTSGSLSDRVRELLSVVDPTVTERESDLIIARIKKNGGRDVLAIVRKNIADGDAAALIGELRKPCYWCVSNLHDRCEHDGNRNSCACWCADRPCPSCDAGDHRRCADRNWCGCSECDELTTGACLFEGGLECKDCPGFMPDGETWCMCFCHGVQPHIERTTASTRFDPKMATNGSHPAAGIAGRFGDVSSLQAALARPCEHGTPDGSTANCALCRARHLQGLAEAKAKLERIKKENRP